ncbi:50S ribosomal protein L28 [Candidatus Nomurabacteria bacterium]|nr:50S ribosomal protein L28 [Candidatus Nomurabacteria bacterium]
MSRVCDTCGRGPRKAASRSHSMIKTLKVARINLQKKDGKKMCTKCIKTETKKQAA